MGRSKHQSGMRQTGFGLEPARWLGGLLAAAFLLGLTQAASAQGAVRSVAVVVVDVLGQHGLQLSTSEDEHPVQHLTPNGADPSLRVGIRPWRPHRRAQHLDSLGREDRVDVALS